MMQLHHDKDAFDERDTIIVVVGAEESAKFKEYWAGKGFEFYGVPNGKETIMKEYGQEVKTLKAGRMPAQFVIDKAGIIRYVHYGRSMKDISDNKEILELLDKL